MGLVAGVFRIHTGSGTEHEIWKIRKLGEGEGSRGRASAVADLWLAARLVLGVTTHSELDVFCQAALKENIDSQCF